MQIGNPSGLWKTVLVSSVTTVVVIVVLAAAAGAAYYFLLRDDRGPAVSSEDGLSDKLRRAGRSLTGGKTDAAKITAVSFSSWGHVGPLYPPPNEPPGYVQSRSVEFRRDLTATRTEKKDYDRDLPDEVDAHTATLTEAQFARLAQILAENDIVNEVDATGNRTEGGTTLAIEYNGEKKSIVTSNMGSDSPAVANVLAAIKQLERELAWTPRP